MNFVKIFENSISEDYDYSAGMSDDAVKAYDNGYKPLSKWTKELILSKLGKFLINYHKSKQYDPKKYAGYYSLYKFLETCSAKILKEYCLEYKSSNETSKFNNYTKFYDLKDNFFDLYTLDNLKWTIAHKPKKTKTSKNKEEYRAYVSYYEYDSNGKDRTKVFKDGTVKGIWFYPDDEPNVKKRVFTEIKKL